ncbi:DUF4198 domain-containing protein [Sulfurimonas sp. HSL-3221]|uniref:DUF4198 domain-containing protein n=1 Tax=Sulfurimonadaceae TaxID=2771471 RepID=UPI001E329503|nr:DUF4198 domain-containing protein [Sulfurimonas sp. HSL-3221]UFS61416.1 DUF4198 domain-containing protein [Sulfurimonas sp. HSL-3221]
MHRLFLLLAMAATLAAHEYWIDASGELQRGHLGAAASEHMHKDEAVKQYPSERYCRQSGGVDEVKGAFGVSERVGAACDTMMVILHLGDYAKTPYGIVAASEANPAMVIGSWESIESVKRLNRLSDFAPLGKGFELSFSRDPSGLEAGDKMRVLATYDGAPKAGAVVAYEGRVVGTTDEAGRINVRIRHAGLQQIRATLRQPLTNAPVAERLYNATLNLEVK